MNLECQAFCSSDAAHSQELQQTLQLAKEYRSASVVLRATGRKRTPLSWAPYRLVTIQAIELYLNAVLQFRGRPASAVKGLHHDLAARADLTHLEGLRLRRKTVRHLKALWETREYVKARYGAGMSDKLSELNRLDATLDDVACVATELIERR